MPVLCFIKTTIFSSQVFREFYYTCPTVVSRSPRLQHVGICGLLHVISWPFCDIVSALTVVGHSLSLVRWRSTLCQMICETPLSAQQLSDTCWKHTFSLPISTFSALGVSHVMRYINLRYLLTCVWGYLNDLDVRPFIYTVNHKKGGRTFMIITLENLDGFL